VMHITKKCLCLLLFTIVATKKSKIEQKPEVAAARQMSPVKDPSAAPTGNVSARRIHTYFCVSVEFNKKHLKNIGPIRHNEPPHAHSADVASGTVARRLCIDVYDNDNA